MTVDAIALEVNLAMLRVASIENSVAATNLFIYWCSLVSWDGTRLHLAKPEQGGPIEKRSSGCCSNRPGGRLMCLAEGHLRPFILCLQAFHYVRGEDGGRS